MSTALINNAQQQRLLQAVSLDSPLGPMLAIADEKELYLLEFAERHGLEHEIERLRFHLKAVIIPGMTEPLRSIERELKSYFEGTLKNFTTPFFLLGSPFQQRVWNTLLQIPYGAICSYAAQAASMGEPKSTRAVANANGANQLAIVIPCHRIISSNGSLGGYAGGIGRKEWLLQHEAKYEE
jgi:AraC family transcriptional regulator of adaptative response/methylated-DNA-[protein]-cysteine methyltransferase